MMKKMNKILVSAAACGVLAANLGIGVSADYIPSFVPGITTTTTTAESAAEDITEIPEDSILDIGEETTISSEVVSETTIPVTELVSGDTEIGGSLTEKTDSDDITDIDESEDELATPDGNGILLEDITDDEINRQFITIQSKNGNTFYIVIDKDRKGNENVYFMNLVDEYDLMAFSEDFPEDAPVKTGKDKKADTEKTAELADEETDDSSKTTDEPAKTDNGGGNTIILLIGAAALVGGGAFYYFKIYKGKANKSKKVVSEDDEDDEPEIEDPNDDMKSETDDSDEE